LVKSTLHQVHNQFFIRNPLLALEVDLCINLTTGAFMKKHVLLTVSVIAIVLSSNTAIHAQTYNDDREDASRNNRVIENQNENINVNRAEKNAAIRRGDSLDQASQSVQLGANKAARSIHQDSNNYNRQKMRKTDGYKKNSMDNNPNSKQDIAKQKRNMAVNQAEKRNAIRNDDMVDEASQNVQIGANKAAIAGEVSDRNRFNANRNMYPNSPNRKPDVWSSYNQ